MNLEKHAQLIFEAGLSRVNSRKLLEQVLSLHDDILKVKTDNEELSIDLSKFSKIKIMGLIKEPKNVDLSTKSEPWTEKELADFRKIMQDIKAKNAKTKKRSLRPKTKKTQTA